MTIRLLSPILINRIAAGEVVERPASVVKELVENALDAQATAIDISIEEGGKRLILVKDNGRGMSKEDLELCIQRHATSKLNDDDLFHISYLGFRGEALPSIGSISRLTIATRRKEDDIGWQITVDHGHVGPIEPVSKPVGTFVKVESLFSSVPARLKFLKTPQTEQAHIVDIICRLALVNLDVSFTLCSGKRTVLELPACADPEIFKEKRLGRLLGEDFISNCVAVEASPPNLTLSGYVGLATLNRSTAAHQYFFVNNRAVRDKTLLASVRAAYQDLLASDRYPVVFLHLIVPPEHVDVNVHPAKAEVRFLDASFVRSCLISAIRDALRQAGHRASSAISGEALSAFKIPTGQSVKAEPLKSYASSRHASPIYSSSPKSREREATSQLIFGLKEAESGVSYAAASSFKQSKSERSFEKDLGAPSVTLMERKGEGLEEADVQAALSAPLGIARAQIDKTYIIAETKNGLVIVDQHAAHERIVYEKLKEELQSDKGINRQALLIPEVVNLTPEQCGLIKPHLPQLEKYGLIIELFGKDAVIIREIPAILGQVATKQLLHDFVSEVAEEGDSAHLEKRIFEKCASISCHNSIRAGRSLNLSEMNALLRQMEETSFSGQCNHGRPTYVELKKKDIEKLFGRR